MNMLRSHIARFIVVALLFAGFSLYAARPAHAKQSSRAFTHWFGTMAKTTDGVALQKELNDFVKIDGQLDELLAKASQIISRYDDQFNFPFPDATASQKVYQLLLIEWSQYQTGNEMAGIPTQSQVKLVSPLFDTFGAAGFLATRTIDSSTILTEQGLNVIRGVSHVTVVSPMSSGIAICAP